MAIAISDVNLKEIYSLSNEDKLDLVNLIINSMRSAKSILKAKTQAPTTSWVSQFEGKWEDRKSADEMVADLRQSRTKSSPVTL